MKRTRRLWQWLGVVFLLSFAALGYIGREIYLTAPPIPKAVVTVNGKTLFTGEQVQNGQRAWLSAGGQQLGTVWGHGSYVAPDWSADWLHREAVALQRVIAKQRGVGETPSAADRAAVDAAMREQMRANTYNEQTGAITVTPERAKAIRQVAGHYVGLFGNDQSLAKVREQYAMTEDALADPQDRNDLTAFFFWTAWAAATDRPGEAN